MKSPSICVKTFVDPISRIRCGRDINQNTADKYGFRCHDLRCHGPRTLWAPSPDRMYNLTAGWPRGVTVRCRTCDQEVVGSTPGQVRSLSRSWNLVTQCVSKYYDEIIYVQLQMHRNKLTVGTMACIASQTSSWIFINTHKEAREQKCLLRNRTRIGGKKIKAKNKGGKHLNSPLRMCTLIMQAHLMRTGIRSHI